MGKRIGFFNVEIFLPAIVHHCLVHVHAVTGDVVLLQQFKKFSPATTYIENIATILKILEIRFLSFSDCRFIATIAIFLCSAVRSPYELRV